MNKKAFTLAEVLITLTIIGVIAALTIPNLMQSYKKHIYVTQLKNWYSDFSNTFNEFNYQAESGWSYNNTAGQYFWTQQNPNFENQVFIKVLDEKYGKTNANKTKQHWQKKL